ncbi:hypothetical protein BST81_09445, partial [Leptolyngbya sp. 'hensonii']|uniref:tetratricopeptide repeat protein n=1 Tax=Leptolyngbya sp. 'hensonii' TaxID=1922337 RepID=UPI000964248C
VRRPEVGKPQNAVFFFNRGVNKFLAEDYKGAIADYTQALKLDAKYTDAYIARGEARRLSGDVPGAIEDSTQALKLDPKALDAYINRCAARYDLRDFRGAIEDCTEALKLNPNDADAYYNRGLARRDLELVEEAMTDFQQSAQLYQQQLEEARRQAATETGINSSSRQPPALPAQPPLLPPRAGTPVMSIPRAIRGGPGKPRGRGIPGRREPAGTR